MRCSTLLVIAVCAALSYDIISARRLLSDKNGRIVGGTEVSIQDYPYMAYLVLFNGTDYFECGGSIISPMYILTAAHCLKDIVSVTARLGSTDSDSGGKTYKTNIFYRHPKYNSTTYDYDVSVIRLRSSITMNRNTSTVALISKGKVIPSGTLVNITGWGVTSEGGTGTGHLMGTTVPTLTNAECAGNLTSTVTDRMLCAGLPQGGKDACQGDSGGPAVNNNLQIGIVSSGFGCARPKTPGLYTNVTNPEIRDWIKRTTRV